MDRLLAARPGTLTVVLTDAAGQPAAPDTVTVTGTSRRTGDVVFGPDSAIEGATPATWTVPLDGTEVADPDVVDTAWSATTDAVTVTYPVPFEFVGAVYVPLPDVTGNVTAASVADAADAITEVAERIETYTGWTWVPRWVRETVSTDRAGMAILPHAPVRTLTDATDADGATLDVTGWRWDREGIVYTGLRSTRVVLGWEAGEDTVPADLARAARDAARVEARRSATRDNRRTADFGDGQFPFQLADLARARPFGIDGVDAVVNGRIMRRV